MPEPDALPEAMAGYPVEGELGMGGMGQVLKVRDTAFDRELALKVARKGRGGDQHLARFIAEGRITGQLQHPGIPPVYSLGQDEHGRWYYTMKRIRGRTLSAILRSGGDEDPAAWSLRRLVTVLVSVCQALSYAHARGVIHRDLKPQNIMCGDYGEVYVVDWGLAKVLGRNLDRAPDSPASAGTILDESAVALPPADIAETIMQGRPDADAASAMTLMTGEADAMADGLRPSTSAWGGSGDGESPIRPWTVPGDSSETASSGLTMAGEHLGTPAYMAPEQASGSVDHDQRTDVYALGAILYQILTGTVPYTAESLSAQFRAIRAGGLDDPQDRAPERDIPDELSLIARRALAPRPDDRYDSCRELGEDLTAWLDGTPRWRVVARPVFDAPTSLDRWDEAWGVKTSLWRSHAGVLQAVGGEQDRLLLFREPFAGDLRLSCTAWCLAGSQAELSIQLCSFGVADARRSKRDGYCLQFGGKAQACANLSRHQLDVQRIDGLRPEPGRRYRLVAEVAAGVVRLLVDGEQVLRWRDPVPLSGGHAGLYAYGEGACFSDIIIESRGKPVQVSVLEAPELLYGEGHFAKALAVYREIAETHPTRAEGRQARLRMGLCLARLGRSGEAREVFAGLRSDPRTAPLAIIGETQAIAWEAADPGVGDVQAAAYLRAQVAAALPSGGSAGHRWQAVLDFAFDRAMDGAGRPEPSPAVPNWFAVATQLAGGLSGLGGRASGSMLERLFRQFIRNRCVDILSRQPAADDGHGDVQAMLQLAASWAGSGGVEAAVFWLRQVRYEREALPRLEVAALRERIAALPLAAPAVAQEAMIADITALAGRYPSLPHLASQLQRDLRRRCRRAEAVRPTARYAVIDLERGTVEQADAIADLPGTDAWRTTRLVLRRIDAGTFLMGDASGSPTDSPVHRVTLTRSFHLGIYPVTQRQWLEIMGYRLGEVHADDDLRPIVDVSWFDVQAFVTRLQEETGLPCGLPSEAQWEYACRAGTSSAYSYGEEADGAQMWYVDNAGRMTHPVGQLPPNPWGLYDMHGQVLEWCADWWGSYSPDEQYDPTGPASGTSRIVRGGSWVGFAGFARSGRRYSNSLGDGRSDLGFRLAVG